MRTCLSTITPIDIDKKDVSVVAVITDIEVHENPVTVTVTRALMDKTKQEKVVADEIWTKYQGKIAEDKAMADVLSALQNALNTNIEAR